MNIKELFTNINLDELCDYLYESHYKKDSKLLKKLEKNITKTNKKYFTKEDIEKSSKIIIYNIVKGTIHDILKIEPEYNEEYKDFYVFAIDSYNDLQDLNSEILDEKILEKYFDIFACDINEMKLNKECLKYNNLKERRDCKKYFNHYGLDFIPRKYILNFNVADVCCEYYGNIKVAGEIFWEMTFYGYSEETIKEKEEEFIEAKNESDKEKFITYNNLEDFFKDLDPDYVMPTKEEMDKSMEDSKKIAELNLKIYNDFFIKFLENFIE